LSTPALPKVPTERGPGPLWPEVIPEKKVELPTTRRIRSGRFIPPMPMEWFRRACRLPGKAGLMAVVVWYLSKVRKSDTVTLSQATLDEFSISRQAKYRALERMESAGLVRVECRHRKNPVVTVLAPQETDFAPPPGG
jgi:hypothetical protein